jgi:hypothetical protein
LARLQNLRQRRLFDSAARHGKRKTQNAKLRSGDPWRCDAPSLQIEKPKVWNISCLFNL